MKTYKLIKSYPDSFKIGHLAVLDKSKAYYNLGTTTRSIYYIENNHEYWQEVCPKCLENIKTCSTFGCKKDYEILSFIVTTAQNCLKKGEKIYRKTATHFSAPGFAEIIEQKLINHEAWSIHSVKRLSDGEVFTIGDKIGKNNTITHIKIDNNVLSFYHWNGTYNQRWGIETLKKYKQPLFTTEDGVDIFERDTTFAVNDDFVIMDYGVVKNARYHIYKHFSTKKAAENYIKMNKPCLSLQEVTELWYKLYNESMKVSYKGYYNELTKIVKQKLK